MMVKRCATSFSVRAEVGSSMMIRSALRETASAISTSCICATLS